MKRKARRREATPVAHMILSKRMADHKPHDMVCELVDNALDADAGRVWIELGRRSITVSDDGSGMEDINDAIRFGKGTLAPRRAGVLGRYGVGMTDALCKLGPRAEVTTLRRGELPSWLHPSSALGIKQLRPRARRRGVPNPPRLCPLTPIAVVRSYSLPRLPGERRTSCWPAPSPPRRTLSSVVPVLSGGPSSASWNRRDL